MHFQSTTNSRKDGFEAASQNGINFYSCFGPSSLTFDESTDFLDRLTDDTKQLFLVEIAADFNTWALDWGSKNTNSRGLALLEAMFSFDVVLLNYEDPPTFRKEGRAQSYSSPS